MKIAVCVSGALRTFPYCAPSIASFFGDVDYYGLFWAQDRGNLMAAIQLPDSTSLERTQQVVDQVDRICAETPGVADRIATVFAS